MGCWDDDILDDPKSGLPKVQDLGPNTKVVSSVSWLLLLKKATMNPDQHLKSELQNNFNFSANYRLLLYNPSIDF